MSCLHGMRVTACLLLNEPTSYSYDARLSLSRDEAGAKASLNRATSIVRYTRNRVIYP